MELELGLKITRTRDDFALSTDLCSAKEPADHIFYSRETNSMFILSAHLRGYRKENIDIGINDNGTQIAICCVKPVQETLIRGWILYKKDAERRFRRVFEIPEVVVLDKIKASFDERKSILVIEMPKRVKGTSGDRIREVEEPEPGIETSEPPSTEGDEALGRDVSGDVLVEETKNENEEELATEIIKADLSSSRRGDVEVETAEQWRRGDVEVETDEQWRRGEVEVETPERSRRGDVGVETDEQSRRGEVEMETPERSRRGDVGVETDERSRRGDVGVETDEQSRRGEVEMETPERSRRGDVGVETDERSRRGDVEMETAEQLIRTDQAENDKDENPTEKMPDVEIKDTFSEEIEGSDLTHTREVNEVADASEEPEELDYQIEEEAATERPIIAEAKEPEEAQLSQQELDHQINEEQEKATEQPSTAQTIEPKDVQLLQQELDYQREQKPPVEEVKNEEIQQLEQQTRNQDVPVAEQHAVEEQGHSKENIEVAEQSEPPIPLPNGKAEAEIQQGDKVMLEDQDPEEAKRDNFDLKHDDEAALESNHKINDEIQDESNEEPVPAANDDNNDEQGVSGFDRPKELGKGDPWKRPNSLCPPLFVAGSALLVSLIVLVISYIRTRKR